MAQAIAADSGAEARRLVDAYQSDRPVLKRNTNCKKCHGRAYDKLPDLGKREHPRGDGETDNIIEHSICPECGGYLFTSEARRVSYATKRDREVRDGHAGPRASKTQSGKLETPDLTAARLAEAQRRAGTKQAPKPKARDYMAEAAEQAAKDADAALRRGQWY